MSLFVEIIGARDYIKEEKEHLHCTWCTKIVFGLDSNKICLTSHILPNICKNYFECFKKWKWIFFFPNSGWKTQSKDLVIMAFWLQFMLIRNNLQMTLLLFYWIFVSVLMTTWSGKYGFTLDIFNWCNFQTETPFKSLTID